MPRRTRPLLALLLAAMAALALAACGEDGEAAADRDPDALLSDTFAPGQRIESGRVALAVRVEPRGDRGEAFALELSGPFQTNGERRLPSVDLDVRAGGSGQAYRVPDPMFRAFRAAYEQAQAGGGSAPLLGLEASTWILDPQIAGEATVGDAETIRIRGAASISIPPAAR